MRDKKRKNEWAKEKYRTDPKYRKIKQFKAQKERENRYNFCANVKVQFGCCECNEDHYACLVFHHEDPMEKRQNTGTGSRPPSIFHLGWENILKELEKCEIMCMNCHQKFHDKEMPKSEIQVFKEAGINLTGKVPDEILGEKKKK